MRDPGHNTVTTVASSGASRPVISEPLDALSNPQVEDLLSPGLALWPRGAIWGTPDGEAPRRDTVIANLTRVLLAPFTYLYTRFWQVTREAFSATADETLENWEADFGLPDPCFPGDASRSERLARLQAKVAAAATITPADFIGLALSYGFEIEIEEPAVYECGFSECGGEHAVGDWRQEIYWIVRITDTAIYFFEAGEGELAADPLFSLGEAEALLCIFKRLSPGWTIPVIETE
ncbi:putative phage tail protein [uncultured Hoeflea sp.]|uniref:putative phage tail protein n=1 Tax=uncultured Hoeflea sp. TaxID=538666 RepID=UPI00261D1AD7|nr:putative phage tail protein [uncultured Hoeflea sp.]